LGAFEKTYEAFSKGDISSDVDSSDKPALAGAGAEGFQSCDQIYAPALCGDN